VNPSPCLPAPTTTLPTSVPREVHEQRVQAHLLKFPANLWEPKGYGAGGSSSWATRGGSSRGLLHLEKARGGPLSLAIELAKQIRRSHDLPPFPPVPGVVQLSSVRGKRKRDD
jgi:hypothetical protein